MAECKALTGSAVKGLILLAEAGVPMSTGVVDTEASLTQTVQQLKHGLGDLKAEWLLMRRDIQEVRLDAGSLRASQSALKVDTARLKAVIDMVKTESDRVKTQLDQLTSLVNKLQSNVRASYLDLQLVLSTCTDICT